MKKILTTLTLFTLAFSMTGCSYIQQGIDTIKSKELEQRTINLSEEKQLEKHNTILKYGSEDAAFLHYLYERDYSEALIYYKVEFVKYMYPYIQSLHHLYNEIDSLKFETEVNQSLLLANDQNLNTYIEKELKLFKKSESYCELIYPSLENVDNFLNHMNENPKDFISVVKNISIFDKHYEEIIFNLIDYNEILFEKDNKLAKTIYDYLSKAYVFDNKEYLDKLETMKNKVYSK